MLNAGNTHFVSNNTTCQFKVPQEVGPFNVEDRESKTIVEMILSRLKLPTIFVWKYDPKGILSNKRRIVIPVAYVHEPHPKLNKIVNLEN